jgi:hypothetical protein
VGGRIFDPELELEPEPERVELEATPGVVVVSFIPPVLFTLVLASARTRVPDVIGARDVDEDEDEAASGRDFASIALCCGKICLINKFEARKTKGLITITIDPD